METLRLELEGAWARPLTEMLEMIWSHFGCFHREHQRRLRERELPTGFWGKGEKKIKRDVTSAGLDPATSSVLTMRDNQLLQPANHIYSVVVI